MIALDTNVLLRLIVKDDAEQVLITEEILERARRHGEQIHISDVVMCELVWNLDRGYHFKKQQIIGALVQIHSSARVHFSSNDRIARAIEAYRKGKGDFADYLIREEAKDEGCRKLFSFDRDLIRSNGFVFGEPDSNGNGINA